MASKNRAIVMSLVFAMANAGWGGTDSRVDEIFAMQRDRILRMQSMDMVYFEDWRPSEYLAAKEGEVPDHLRARHEAFQYQQEGAKFRVETGVDGTLDDQPDSIRHINAFDLNKYQHYQKDNLWLRVQRRTINPAAEYNLPFLLPYRAMNLGREITISGLTEQATWDDLKKRVRQVQDTVVAERDCVMVELDYSQRNVACRVYFAKGSAYYPVKVQLIDTVSNESSFECVVDEVRRYDTRHGPLDVPVVLTQNFLEAETGRELFSVRSSIDPKRFSINQDVPDEVFTIPLHMARVYEDDDDITKFYDTQDVATRGLDELSESPLRKETLQKAVGEPIPADKKIAEKAVTVPPVVAAAKATPAKTPAPRGPGILVAAGVLLSLLCCYGVYRAKRAMAGGAQ